METPPLKFFIVKIDGKKRELKEHFFSKLLYDGFLYMEVGDQKFISRNSDGFAFNTVGASVVLPWLASTALSWSKLTNLLSSSRASSAFSSICDATDCVERAVVRRWSPRKSDKFHFLQNKQKNNTSVKSSQEMIIKTISLCLFILCVQTFDLQSRVLSDLSWSRDSDGFSCQFLEIPLVMLEVILNHVSSYFSLSWQFQSPPRDLSWGSQYLVMPPQNCTHIQDNNNNSNKKTCFFSSNSYSILLPPHLSLTTSSDPQTLSQS